LKNYDGQEMTIRITNNGKFQVLPQPCTPQDMSRAPVFATQAEAETYIVRPMPEWVATERELTIERMKYNVAYAAILSHPEMREMRREIQRLHEIWAWSSKLAGDAQRAVSYGIGHISAMGRNVAEVRQGNADYQADDATRDCQIWNDACHDYERALQQAMSDAGIPIELFRNPVLIAQPTGHGV